MEHTRKPRFLQEEIVVALKDRLLTAGVVRERSYSAPVTKDLVEAVCARCDGLHTLQEIADLLPGTSVADVEAVLRFLHSLHLLEINTAIPQPQEKIPPNIDAFIRRLAVQHRCELSTSTLLGRLARTCVLVAGTSSTQTEQSALVHALTGCGLRSVTLLEEAIDSLRNMIEPNGNRWIVVVGIARAETEGQEDWNRWCADLLAKGVLWFPIYLHPLAPVTDVGPLFSSTDRCYGCWRNSVDHPPSEPFGSEEERSSAWMATAALASVEILWSILGISEYASQGRGRRICEVSGVSQEILPLMQSRCQSCEIKENREAVISPVVSALEASIRRSRRSVLGYTFETSYKQFVCSNPDLPKSFTESRHIGLVEEQNTGCATNRANNDSMSLSFAQLSSLLCEALGEKRGGAYKVQRRHATAGNLGSVELFVVARDVQGLDAGYYLFEGHNRSLAALEKRAGATPVAQFVKRIISQTDGPPPAALLVWYGSLWRLLQKYSTLAYRLMHLDAGVAQLQFLMAARAHGVAVSTLAEWPDNLVESELNLLSMDEQVTGITALWPSQEAMGRGLPASILPSLTGSSQPEFISKEARVSALFSEERLLSDVYQLCRRTETAGGNDVKTIPARARGVTPRADWSWTHNPPLASVFELRRSQRHYDNSPVQQEDILNLLRRAYDLTEYISPALPPQAVRLLLLARNVGGLESGSYLYDLTSSALIVKKSIYDFMAFNELYFTRAFAAAPAAIWAVGDLPLACTLMGSNGYRATLVRAGAMINRIWLEAIGTGLAACPVAGVVTGQATKILNLDAVSEIPLLALPLGYPL